ncbi:hypothetical protein DVH05_016942 [Phytophthora capsici]|nr:hypothetical protein DVH05_016942 [Phytophthora capsici]
MKADENLFSVVASTRLNWRRRAALPNASRGEKNVDAPANSVVAELEALQMLDDEIGEIDSDLDFANEADEEGESLSDSS